MITVFLVDNTTHDSPPALKKRITAKTNDVNVESGVEDNFAPAATSASSPEFATDIARVDPSTMELVKEWECILRAVVDPSASYRSTSSSSTGGVVCINGVPSC